MFKVIGALITTAFVTIASIVGYTFYQGYKMANMSPETVSRLADQIVDPSVSAQKLAKQGFYNVKFGGFYLDECRQSILTNTFNLALATEAKAGKISDCIYQRTVELGARRSNVTVINR